MSVYQVRVVGLSRCWGWGRSRSRCWRRNSKRSSRCCHLSDGDESLLDVPSFKVAVGSGSVADGDQASQGINIANGINVIKTVRTRD